MCVLHSRDNPPCVNPAHLRSGSEAENARDRLERGRERHLLGEDVWSSKLTGREVEEIRLLADSGDLRQVEIAELYGIVQSQVSAIKLRKVCPHLS